MATSKKIKLKEDSRNYVTKITTDDKGDISSMKTRRTLKGFIAGAPRVKKAEAQSSYKKGGSVGKSKVNEAGNYTKPGMRKSLFNKIKAGTKGGDPGEWSARKAQLLAKQYKSKGGGYK